MFHKLTCSEVIKIYRIKHKLIAPDNDSISLTRDLWDEWERSGIVPPPIDDIAKNYHKHETEFFYELVSLAERMENDKLSIHLCQFTLDEYNAYALSARDGFIVLVDDVFFQVLFFLCCILVFDSMEVVQTPEERTELKRVAQEIIEVNYFSKQRIDFSEQGIISRLMKRDYQLTEFANYLFNSLKAFIISHEIGHHVLKHTLGPVCKKFGMTEAKEEIEVDARRIESEFEADAYGYKLFHELSHLNDDKVYYAWCKYKLLFAPVLLFDLFNCLDRLQEQKLSILLKYKTHPHPSERISALKTQYAIDDTDPMYNELKKTLDYYLGSSLESSVSTGTSFRRFSGIDNL